MPTMKQPKTMKLPAGILAEIAEMATPKSTARVFSDTAMAIIRQARGKHVSWANVSLLIEKHSPADALCASALMLRNKKEGWGL